MKFPVHLLRARHFCFGWSFQQVSRCLWIEKCCRKFAVHTRTPSWVASSACYRICLHVHSCQDARSAVPALIVCGCVLIFWFPTNEHSGGRRRSIFPVWLNSIIVTKVSSFAVTIDYQSCKTQFELKSLNSRCRHCRAFSPIKWPPSFSRNFSDIPTEVFFNLFLIRLFS
jgi:hypothetical protein